MTHKQRFDASGKLVSVDGQLACQNCGWIREHHAGKQHTGRCLRIPQAGWTDTGRRFYLRWKEPTLAQLLNQGT